MREIELCREICANPKAQYDAALAKGKKIVGVMPYFCPEELAYAAGMLPFGLWGTEIQANDSKRYFPAFICSILHTTLEMGLRGDLNDLSAIMIPISCDSLKGMGANWEYGVKAVPVINVAYAQNRKAAYGVEFTVSQLRKIKAQLEEIAGRTISDTDIREAIQIYNTNRDARMAFSNAAAVHPDLVSAVDRAAVLKAGYFMDRAVHTELLCTITSRLNAEPASTRKGLRIVTTGILADQPELLKILDENCIAIAADQIAHESVTARYLTPCDADPLKGIARRLGNLEGCSVLYDPGKQRGQQLVQLVKETNADGVLWLMTKFCDPEEYDYVPVRKMLDSCGIPLLAVEVDQQMVNFAQARSAIEAFSEMLREKCSGPAEMTAVSARR